MMARVLVRRRDPAETVRPDACQHGEVAVVYEDSQPLGRKEVPSAGIFFVIEIPGVPAARVDYLAEQDMQYVRGDEVVARGVRGAGPNWKGILFHEKGGQTVPKLYAVCHHKRAWRIDLAGLPGNARAKLRNTGTLTVPADIPAATLLGLCERRRTDWTGIVHETTRRTATDLGLGL